MLKDTKRRVIQTIIAIVVATGIILSAIVLWKWTHAIQSDQDRKNLQKVLRTIVDDQGESALLSLSGIPVSDIFYGDEDRKSVV